MLSNFNILASTSRGNERLTCNELIFLLKAIGDPDPIAAKTGIRGLVAAKTNMDPVEAIEKLRGLLSEKPYEFRYSLRILPVEKVVQTDLEEVKLVAREFSLRMSENETFRVTVETRFTTLHTHDLIEAAATEIRQKVDLEKPDKVLLIEVVDGLTGMSLIKPQHILSVLKEKML
jgi:tRNA acetyltransferase TAN1